MKFLPHETLNIDEIKDGIIFVFGGHKKSHMAYLENGSVFSITADGSIKKIESRSVFPLWITKFSKDEAKAAVESYPNKLFKLYKQALMDKRAKYTACALPPESQQQLFMKMKHLIPKDWEVACHHMTINLGVPCKEVVEQIGQRIYLTATGYGISEEHQVMCVEVEAPIWSKNEFKHITVALNKKEGARAMNSNKITEIIPFEKPVVLESYVGIFLNNGGFLTKNEPC